MSSKNAHSSQNAKPARSRQWSLARRLTVFYVATTAVLLILAAVYLYWSQVANLDREDNDFLVNKIQDCRRVIAEGSSDAQLLSNEVQIEPAASLIKYYVRLLDNSGQSIMETAGMAKLLPVRVIRAPANADDPANAGIIRKDTTIVLALMVSAKAPSIQQPEHSRILQVALDVSEEAAMIEHYRWTLLAVVITGILFSGGAGFFVTRKGLAPLNEITHATQRITASQLHERIMVDGWPVELASLARSFDRMLDRLEDSFNRLSQFSADLAHELRTPINNLRGEAGVALSQPRTPEEYRRTLESSLEEYARLSRLIDNLLFLARTDGSKITITRAPCDVQKSIEGVREFYEALAEDRGVEVCCEGAGVVNADPVLFRQAVSNLLSNALNYTPRGGRVVIRADAHNDGPFEIRVSDSGCGISDEHLPRIFDRLYRVDPARSQYPSGAGLGLAIVKSIMALHGGSVAAQSESGKGASFTLVFPPAPAGLSPS